MVGVRGSIPLAPTISYKLLTIGNAGILVSASEPMSKFNSAIKRRTERQRKRAIRAKHVCSVARPFPSPRTPGEPLHRARATGARMRQGRGRCRWRSKTRSRRAPRRRSCRRDRQQEPRR